MVLADAGIKFGAESGKSELAPMRMTLAEFLD
jgi:hypothetical protein